MASPARCADCGITITHDRHRFLDPDPKTGREVPGLQYCDFCCPRCTQGTSGNRGGGD